MVGAHQILDLNIHITGVQYIRTHPTGSRRPKTALLAVSRSMHWLCLHPHSPFASHSLTDSLTHQICSDPAANHQSARGATHARGSDGLTRPTGDRKTRSGEESERGRERERGTGERWTRSRGRLAGSPNAASQPASRQVSLLPAQQPSYKNVCRLYVCMYVCMDVCNQAHFCLILDPSFSSHKNDSQRESPSSRRISGIMGENHHP